MKNYYQIDGENEQFKILHDAKHHVWIAYTPKERIRELTGTCINHVRNGDVVSITPIYVDENGSYSFGRTIKFTFGQPFKYSCLRKIKF